MLIMVISFIWLMLQFTKLSKLLDYNGMNCVEFFAKSPFIAFVIVMNLSKFSNFDDIEHLLHALWLVQLFESEYLSIQYFL